MMLHLYKQPQAEESYSSSNCYNMSPSDPNWFSETWNVLLVQSDNVMLKEHVLYIINTQQEIRSHMLFILA